jgi:hypothetical protein
MGLSGAAGCSVDGRPWAAAVCALALAVMLALANTVSTRTTVSPRFRTSPRSRTGHRSPLSAASRGSRGAPLAASDCGRTHASGAPRSSGTVANKPNLQRLHADKEVSG